MAPILLIVVNAMIITTSVAITLASAVKFLDAFLANQVQTTALPVYNVKMLFMWAPIPASAVKFPIAFLVNQVWATALPVYNVKMLFM